jgi:hypothetical protein
LDSESYFASRWSINLWIGHCHSSLEFDSIIRESPPSNVFSELSQILGSCPVRTMNTFRFEPHSQNSEPLTNHFSLVSELYVSFQMVLNFRIFPHARWKGISISPNHACYLRRARTLSIFPCTRPTSGNSPIYCQEPTLRCA